MIRTAGPADLTGLLALEAGFASDRISARAMRRLLTRDSAVIRVVDGDAPDSAGTDTANHLAAALVLLFRHGTRYARVYSLIVAPAHRGRGLADALLADAVELARLAGCTRLGLEVSPANTPAVRLYTRHGFAPVAEIAGYYSNGGPAQRMVHGVGPAADDEYS